MSGCGRDMKKAVFLSILFCVFPFLCGCQDVTGETSPTVPATLIYMVADNNLDYYAISNIKQMERGLTDDTVSPVFVFLTRRIGANPSHPYLLRITRNTEDSIIRSPIIRTYPQQNTCDPVFLRKVIADVKNHCKAYNAVLSRLVLWSHGTGWLPEGTPFNEIDDEDDARAGKNGAAMITYSFGLDETGYGDGEKYRKEMDIKDLAKALEGEQFELLIMDACFMGTIEVAYELRNISDYIILSPAEIVANGFPYEDIINLFTYPTIEPLAIAVSIYEYYNNQRGALQTAAVSVINTRYLEDLAHAMESVYRDYKTHRNELPIGNFLQYDRTASNYFFDYLDFVSHISSYTQNDYSPMLKIYDRVLPHYLHTPKIFGVLDITGTSGLSIYIPNTHLTRDELHEYYQGLSWTQDSNATILFN
jgi:hypothetical protein